MRRALLIALVFGVTACGAPEAGVVTGKKYEKPYTWVEFTQVGTVQVPVFHDEPEQFKLRISDGEDEGWVSVPAFTWERKRVGDDYP